MLDIECSKKRACGISCGISTKYNSSDSGLLETLRLLGERMVVHLLEHEPKNNALAPASAPASAPATVPPAPFPTCPIHQQINPLTCPRT